jgi:hypothetical protein
MPVVLLCHCDGTNGSTTFTDTSLSLHTLTPTSCTVSTTSPKFGTGSADFTANSAARINISGGSTADFCPSAGAFTVEMWAYFTSAPSGAQVMAGDFGASNNLGWNFQMVGAALYFVYSTTGLDSPSVNVAYTPTLNTWIHLAVDRDASHVLRLYANGAVLTSSTVSSTIFAATRPYHIGNDDNLNRAFPGRLDEVRITMGQAQYGGAFTPPSAPFADPVATAAQARVMMLA